MTDDKPPSFIPTLFNKVKSTFFPAPLDKDSVLETLRDAGEQHVLNKNAISMIEGVFTVDEMQVRDIMVPRSQIVSLCEDDSLDDIFEVVVETGFSRFPVYDDDRENIVGILLAKDILRYFEPEKRSDFVLKDILRPAFFVPESKRLNVLLKEYQNNQNHMAIVVDEYSAVAGMVTIEDILEEIVGEIEDEHDMDEDQLMILARGKNRYTLKALTPLEEFNRYFSAKLNTDGSFDTIGGVIMSKFGYLPKRDESISVEGYKFRILKADSRRIHLLELTKDLLEA